MNLVIKTNLVKDKILKVALKNGTMSDCILRMEQYIVIVRHYKT